MVFPVVMYGYESWTMKTAKHQGNDAFKLWCWRTISRVPWTAKRSNQSILREINSEHSLEELMLKLQYLDHMMWRADLIRKDPDAGRDWGQEENGQRRMRWLHGITDLMDMNLSKLREIAKDRKALHAVVHGVAKSWTWPSNWTTTTEDQVYSPITF